MAVSLQYIQHDWLTTRHCQLVLCTAHSCIQLYSMLWSPASVQLNVSITPFTSPAIPVNTATVRLLTSSKVMFSYKKKLWLNPMKTFYSNICTEDSTLFFFFFFFLQQHWNEVILLLCISVCHGMAQGEAVFSIRRKTGVRWGEKKQHEWFYRKVCER